MRDIWTQATHWKRHSIRHLIHVLTSPDVQPTHLSLKHSCQRAFSIGLHRDPGLSTPLFRFSVLQFLSSPSSYTKGQTQRSPPAHTLAAPPAQLSLASKSIACILRPGIRSQYLSYRMRLVTLLVRKILWRSGLGRGCWWALPRCPLARCHYSSRSTP